MRTAASKRRAALQFGPELSMKQPQPKGQRHIGATGLDPLFMITTAKTCKPIPVQWTVATFPSCMHPMLMCLLGLHLFISLNLKYLKISNPHAVTRQHLPLSPPPYGLPPPPSVCLPLCPSLSLPIQNLHKMVFDLQHRQLIITTQRHLQALAPSFEEPTFAKLL
jgi:hypothetical protein